ncbi:unannotated protein [freshwater metagenome]|uniref:Unannotated protein n=1 Tax=freshwater metagenome TaxID=449393 RepID=A0A6J7HX89_9ZZZZ|nr:tyrosine-type recombinase/integrase [Actinomycetota bacterium]
MSVERRSKASGVTYVVRWRENGRQRAKTFLRRADAQAWDVELRRRRELGPLAVQQLTNRSQTLNEFIEDHWVPEHGVTLEKSTRRTYADLYRLYIEPPLGDVPLQNITVSEVRKWQSELQAERNASPDLVGKCRTVLSSVLRHALEAEAVAGNPVGAVKAPKREYKDAVDPLAPATVEAVRGVLLGSMATDVPECTRHGARVSAYVVPDERTPASRLQDALVVSLIAYAGLRPGELRALRWSDVRERTILVDRAADDDGTDKDTKSRARRTIKLIDPLAADLEEYRQALGGPGRRTRVLTGSPEAWRRGDWHNWRAVRWRQACKRADVEPTPRPYDLRHSFASLLLAEGQTVHYVASQLGHSPKLTLDTYGHLFAEFADRARIDPVAEIMKARGG